MPWDRNILTAVSRKLRQSAQAGEFVPFVWTDRIETTDDGGCRFFGCGWGIVGFTAAVMLEGTNWAKQMMPVGATQTNVDRVLIACGLTTEEIAWMTPATVWQSFDHELKLAYDNRHQDWTAFILKSMQLAEMFIRVLERVEVTADFNVFVDVPPAAKPLLLMLTDTSDQDMLPYGDQELVLAETA